MTDLTPEEIKELWELCGLKRNTDLKKGYHYERAVKVGNWLEPDGTTCGSVFMKGHMKGHIPELTLDNLFRWGGDKVDRIELQALGWGSGKQDENYMAYVERRGNEARTYHKYPVQALAKAVLEVLRK